MAIINVATTDTFRTWYTRTNQTIDFVNNKAIGDGQTVYGVFTIGSNANSSLSVTGSLFVNTSIVNLTTNTFIQANTTITANANVVNMAPGTLIIQPVNGTKINTAVTINATTTLLAPLTSNADVTVNGAFTLNGAASITGTATVNGAIFTHQVAFLGANAVLAPAALTDPQYDNFTTSGLSEAQILSVQPNIDTVWTGIQAPNNLGANGARWLVLQNISSSFKLTLASANTSSGANNQFATPGNQNVDILPGGTLAVLWTTTNHNWRVMAPLSIASANFSTAGNVVVGNQLLVTNTLSITSANQSYINSLLVSALVSNSSAALANVAVSGNSSFSANASFAANITFTGAAIKMANLTSTFLQWGTSGAATPSVTTRSVGTKIVLYDNLSSTTVDFALGVSSGTLWHSVPNSGSQFQWYANTGVIMTLSGLGDITSARDFVIGRDGSVTRNMGVGGTMTVVSGAAFGANVTVNNVFLPQQVGGMKRTLQLNAVDASTLALAPQTFTANTDGLAVVEISWPNSLTSIVSQFVSGSSTHNYNESSNSTSKKVTQTYPVLRGETYQFRVTGGGTNITITMTWYPLGLAG